LSVYQSFILHSLAGCCNFEFDSAYPIHLTGIINRDEFQESISRINRALLSFKTYLIITWVTFALSIGGGTASIIIGGAIAGANNSVTTVFYVLLGVGVGLTTFGSVFFSIAYCIVYSQRIARMRQAIAEESMKYSSRLSIPCSWRLENLILPWGGYSYYNNHSPGYNVSSLSITKTSIKFLSFS
jgi:hypothetical protein